MNFDNDAMLDAFLKHMDPNKAYVYGEISIMMGAFIAGWKAHEAIGERSAQIKEEVYVAGISNGPRKHSF